MDRLTTAREIMTTDLTTVLPNTLVKDFKNKFSRRHFHHMPVENEQGELLGIISTEDINRIYRMLPAVSQSLEAQHIMTPMPVSISPDTLLTEVTEVFLDNDFRALPVVGEKGHLEGLITPYDVMEAFLKAFKLEQEQGEDVDHV